MTKKMMKKEGAEAGWYSCTLLTILGMILLEVLGTVGEETSVDDGSSSSNSSKQILHGNR
jgi:hypothetical protein